MSNSESNFTDEMQGYFRAHDWITRYDKVGGCRFFKFTSRNTVAKFGSVLIRLRLI